MIVYIIKIILCTAFFYSVYKLLFENEKMHQFNRFYLLFSVIFSLIVPFVVIGSITHIQSPNIESIVYTPIKSTPKLIPAIHSSEEHIVNYSTLIFAVYLFITLLILIHFVRNLYKIYKRKNGSPVLTYCGFKIITLQERITPHSFLNFIFLSHDDYHAGVIEKEILQHELTHVKQKHSYDILFIEFLIALFWFNPFLYLYRKSIKLNHEYLADDAVINIYHQPIKY